MQNTRFRGLTLSESDVWSGVAPVGEHELISGNVTDLGKAILSDGEQNLIDYFENAREFDDQKQAHGHLAPLDTHGTIQGAEFNAEAEIERLQLAVHVLQQELQRRI